MLKSLGDELFTYRFENSAVLAKLTEGHSPDTHPQYYTKHCWDVSWNNKTKMNKLMSKKFLTLVHNLKANLNEYTGRKKCEK